MDGYKKIFYSQEFRMRILKWLSFIPDKQMIQFQYLLKTGRFLNLKQPKRYTEKLQYYKLFHRNEIMTSCVDKFNVRKFVIEKGLSFILTKLYGHYETINNINFSSLPNSFIIKTTNGSGTNIICKNKKEMDIAKIKKKLQNYLNRPQISAGREWAYYNVKPSIIIEELLEDIDNPYGGINDYKFLCFGGKVYCIVLDVGRYKHHRRNFYDKMWNKINVESDHETIDDVVNPPNKLKEMIRIAEILSEDFPAVRVDLYCINDKIYFGELTFYPWSGYVKFTPDSFDFELGKQFILP